MNQDRSGHRKIVSIITPSFNQLEWLPLNIKSVQNQVLNDSSLFIEHIIQDSQTQGFWDTFKDCNKITQNYRLVGRSAPDNGMYDALNRGLASGEGEIFAWLNCDEQYLEEAIQLACSFLNSHPEIDVLFADAIIVNEFGQALSYRKSIIPSLMHTKHCGLRVLSCSTFFRRRIVQKGFRFDPKWRAVGDAVWIQKLLENNISMATMNCPLATYTYTGMNLSCQQTGDDGERILRLAENRTTRLKQVVGILHDFVIRYCAGAYNPRAISYKIFTKDSPEKRRLFEHSSIGYKWPRNTYSNE